MTGDLYFLRIVDDFSRFTWTILMTRNEETADHLITINMIETQLSWRTKVIRSDNGMKFLSNKLSSYNQKVVSSKLHVNTHLNEMVLHKENIDTYMSSSCVNVPIQCACVLWGDCIIIATTIINRVPSEILSNKCSYEVLLHKSPLFNHIRVFDCLCSFTNINPSRGNFDPTTKSCVFTGYPPGHKTYKIYDLQSHSIQISRDTDFHEDSVFQNIQPF